MTEKNAPSDTHADSDQASSRSLTPSGTKKPASRRLVIGLGAAVLAGGAFFALRGGEHPAVKPAAAPDTPRVEGPNIHYSKTFAERSGLKLT
ncbi:MAG TPA: hypothetical protein VGQ57_19380, partial [Polyangiaceae bacterium]|nr:hypothetical protein [Polyangiaceae bacterium]